MYDTFFESPTPVHFPESVKVRLRGSRPARVWVTLQQLGSSSTEGEAEFEIVLLDSDGYMESVTVLFRGKTSSPYAKEVPGISTKTTAVYIIPRKSTDARPSYTVKAGY